MKTISIHLLLALTAGFTATAQPPQQGDRRPPHPPSPIIGALDTDQDHSLSAEEIAAAATSLATLDKDSDGTITSEELPFPPPRDKKPRDGDGEEEISDKPDRKPPVPPIVATLDANHDGTISADEIKAAPEALKALDKNKDGELTPEELHPRGKGRPPRDERPGRDGKRPQGPPPEKAENP